MNYKSGYLHGENVRRSQYETRIFQIIHKHCKMYSVVTDPLYKLYWAEGAASYGFMAVHLCMAVNLGIG